MNDERPTPEPGDIVELLGAVRGEVQAVEGDLVHVLVEPQEGPPVAAMVPLDQITKMGKPPKGKKKDSP